MVHLLCFIIHLFLHIYFSLLPSEALTLSLTKIFWVTEVLPLLAFYFEVLISIQQIFER